MIFVCDPDAQNSVIYDLYHCCVGRMFLYTCCYSDIGPMRVVGRRLVNIVFCNQGLSHDTNFDLTPYQVYDDYKKDSWTHDNHNMDYTQDIEMIIDLNMHFC